MREEETPEKGTDEPWKVEKYEAKYEAHEEKCIVFLRDESTQFADRCESRISSFFFLYL